MTLMELCEPLFQYVCRLNRSGRRGAKYEFDTVRGQVKGLFGTMKATATADFKLNEQYEKVEIPLKFFVDSILSESRLNIAKQWHSKRLAFEWKELAGDEKFWDPLLEGELKDPTDAATERLAIYYTCIGLGFTGWYAGQPDKIKKKMAQIAERIWGYMKIDEKGRICPEAYEHIDTRNLIQPPAQKLIGIVIAIIGFVIVLFITNAYMYSVASRDLDRAIKVILKHEPVRTGPVASLAPPAGAKKEVRP